MNELNKIENAIKEIDATTFQKLCDEYLSRILGGTLNPLGSTGIKFPINWTFLIYLSMIFVYITRE